MRKRLEIAGFFRLALLLQLIRQETVIAWADEEILLGEVPDEKIIDLALSAGKSRDQIILALREVEGWPYHSPGLLHLLAALLWRRLSEGKLTALATAKLLYSLVNLSADAEAVFGPSIYCIDDYFEPYMPSRDYGNIQLRKMLLPFANEALPSVVDIDPV